MKGQHLYLTDREIMALVHTCEEWIDVFLNNTELYNKRLDGGLGSVLYKLYKGTPREETYEKYRVKKT